MIRRSILALASALVLAVVAGTSAVEAKSARPACSCCGASCACPACSCDASASTDQGCACCGPVCCSAV
jgi:hypothetical protein